jgi:large subunit ribosomal protein L10
MATTTKAERTEVIEKLEKDFVSAKGLYLTDFNKINVEQITQLRVKFREKGVQYVVVKNTLAKKALERCSDGKEDLVKYLKGTVGIALSCNDGIAPAKVIQDFQKDNKDLLSLKIAYVDGGLFSAQDAVRLADLPSREVLLSQLLSCLKAPMSNMVGSLSGVFTKLVGTLESVKNQKASQS